MSTAKVQSIEAVKTFRLALLRFADVAGSALTDADAELQRSLNWLETEQHSYWEGQIRKRTELVARARLQVQIKRSSRHIDGTPGTATEEEQALKLAIQRLEEAQLKLSHVQRNSRRLQREILAYRGQMQRFATAVAVDIPLAVSRLDAIVGNLQDYVALQPSEAGELAVGEDSASMARPEPVTDMPAAEKASPSEEAKPPNESTDPTGDPRPQRPISEQK